MAHLAAQVLRAGPAGRLLRAGTPDAPNQGMYTTTLTAALALFLPATTALRPAAPSLPWVFDLDVVAAVTPDDPGARLPDDTLGEPDDACGAGARTTLGLRFDLGSGREYATASYTGGIAVHDAEAKLVAFTPGLPCGGSADALEVLAVGKAYGAPLVAAVFTTGGRREALTWLGLYRVGHGGRLEAVFSGAVEQREDDRVTRGSVKFFPGGLIHREPTGEQVLWTWDDGAGLYVPHALTPMEHG